MELLGAIVGITLGILVPLLALYVIKEAATSVRRDGLVIAARGGAWRALGWISRFFLVMLFLALASWAVWALIFGSAIDRIIMVIGLLLFILGT